MQTFLPYADFRASAGVLDPRRLGKQRVEVIQVVRAISRPDYGWRHHPVARMWRHHPAALGAYGMAITDTWIAMGFSDTCQATIRSDLAEIGVEDIPSQEDLRASGALPPWLGDDRLHRSHRSALVRKDPDWYGPRFPDVTDDLPYFWPSD
ncbi:MSMEG_6728 family protein [Dermatobacter hominis]|uniref:MSMEG_6728 family protein n=1 Tax=Dermatobacter hominis TaxID=2884263 RepID=UPI001D11C9C5|nr:MSMEG_6728 family protein [Dermatobacter hominis]UDY34940.1 MSMEG_6728 family protein [Dermatobacter hominis]